MGPGKSLGEFAHVDNFAEAVAFEQERWDPSSINVPKDKNNFPLNILNVRTGKKISIKEHAFKISDLLNYKGRIIGTKRSQIGYHINYETLKK